MLSFRNVKTLCVSGAFILSMLAGSAFATPVDYSNHSLVKVKIESRSDLKLLKEISPDIWTENITPNLPVMARIPPEQIMSLKQSGLVFEVVDNDLGPELSRYYPESRRSNPRDPGSSIYEEYKTYDEMISILSDLDSSCPVGLSCETFSIGQSVEGKDIFGISFESEETPEDGERPAVFFQSLQHAREWIAGSATLCLADYVVNNYDKDKELQELLARVKIFIIPCVNPDGYQYSWDEDRGWRKNRRDNGDNVFGVDLNRNWGFMWGYDDEGSSPYPEDGTYRGTGPLSEPETKAITDFATANPQIVAYGDIHSFGQLILFPWGYALDPYMTEGDGEMLDTLSQEMADVIAGIHDENYWTVQGAEWYPANGGAMDYFYADRLGLSFTLELRPDGNDYDEGFVLSPQYIAPTCEETTPAFLHLASWAAANGDFESSIADAGPGIDSGPDADSDTDSDSDSDTDTDTDTEDTDTTAGDPPPSDEPNDDSCGCSSVGSRDKSTTHLIETIINLL